MMGVCENCDEDSGPIEPTLEAKELDVSACDATARVSFRTARYGCSNLAGEHAGPD